MADRIRHAPGHVVVPEGVRALDPGAFWCTPIYHVSLPSSVVSIEPRSFAFCESTDVTEKNIRPQAPVYIDVDPSNPRFASIGGTLVTKGPEPVVLSVWYEDVPATFGMPARTDLVRIAVPEGAARLARGSIAFSNPGRRLVLDLPDSLAAIDEGALAGQRIARLSIGPNLAHVSPDFWTNVSDDDARLTHTLALRNRVRVSVHPDNPHINAHDGLLVIPSDEVVS